MVATALDHIRHIWNEKPHLDLHTHPHQDGLDLGIRAAPPPVSFAVHAQGRELKSLW